MTKMSKKSFISSHSPNSLGSKKFIGSKQQHKKTLKKRQSVRIAESESSYVQNGSFENNKNEDLESITFEDIEKKIFGNTSDITENTKKRNSEKMLKKSKHKVQVSEVESVKSSLNANQSEDRCLKDARILRSASFGRKTYPDKPELSLTENLKTNSSSSQPQLEKQKLKKLKTDEKDKEKTKRYIGKRTNSSNCYLKTDAVSKTTTKKTYIGENEEALPLKRIPEKNNKSKASKPLKSLELSRKCISQNSVENYENSDISLERRTMRSSSKSDGVYNTESKKTNSVESSHKGDLKEKVSLISTKKAGNKLKEKTVVAAKSSCNGIESNISDSNSLSVSPKLETQNSKPIKKGKSKTAKKQLAHSKSKKAKNLEAIKVESNSDSSDWEDVDELSEILKSKDNKEPSSVQIELEANNILWGIKKRKRRSEQDMIEDYLRKEINKSTREVYENMHKTHLLCLLAHGMYVNSLLGSETLSSCALSVIPKLYYSPKRLDLSHLEKFLNWFSKHISIKNCGSPELAEGSGIEESLQQRFETKTALNNKEFVLMFVIITRVIGMTVRFVQNLTPLSWKPPISALIKPKKIQEPSTEDKFCPTTQITSKYTQETQDNQNKLKKQSRKMLSSDSEPDISLSKPKKFKKSETYLDNDDDFTPSRNFNKGQRCSSSNSSKRRISEDTKSEIKTKKESLQEWVEVYIEEEEKWIPVDVSKNKIHCANEIAGRTSTLAYVVAFNPDQTVKDVTKRYMSTWLSYKDKVRCDSEWWETALKPFVGNRNRRDKEEDKEMDSNLKLQPLPKTINEYKNHPLYALQRHLLKFEAIYPPDAAPVGYIKKEPVFPRECVKTLYGRDNWFREGKTVRVGEEPYKIVKARPKWDRKMCQIIKDRPLEIFGEWQVEDYDPPTAKNGKVPRNEYGNVDLFKPTMLPKGCVHLQIPGLHKIARKLNIDCAPAITGFDFHNGAGYPIHDGFIVCKEHKELLEDAWNQDQVEQAQKEEEKRINRIYGNWKKMINGIILKDKLKEKYGVNLDNQDLASGDTTKKVKKKIKQEDLNSLPSTTVVHPVVNLKIDFAASVADEMGTKKTRKRKKTTITQESKKHEMTHEKSLLSSDSDEDMNDSAKREQIRSILQWNPKDAKKDTEPTLSDDSDEKDSSIDPHLRNSSLLLTPSSLNKDECLLKRQVMKSHQDHRLVSKRLDNSRKGIAWSSDSSDSENAVPLKELPKIRSPRKRNAKKAVNYKNSDESESDISVDDSDDGDKAYDPLKEREAGK